MTSTWRWFLISWILYPSSLLFKKYLKEKDNEVMFKSQIENEEYMSSKPTSIRYVPKTIFITKDRLISKLHSWF